jgi:hypothetical protein
VRMGLRSGSAHRDPRFKFLFGPFTAALLHPVSLIFTPNSFDSHVLVHEHTEGYKEEYRWWEAVVLARKLMLQLVVVFIREPLIQGRMCV